MTSFLVALFFWIFWHVALFEKLSLRVIQSSEPFQTQDPVKSISQNMSAMRSPPTFIHIPKTGGVSIENGLSIHGIYVGKHAFTRMDEKIQRTYKIQQSRCSAWHSLPLEDVHNSITVVRDPLDRLVSEFCYTHKVLHHAELSCEGLSNWILHVLSHVLTGNKHTYNCHLLAQWEFAKRADIIIPFCALGTEHGNQMLSEHFYIANFTLGKENDGVSHDRKCKNFTNSVQWATNVTSCISSAAYAMFQYTYRDDYKNLEKHFTCA
jgi:hypothetical protein